MNPAKVTSLSAQSRGRCAAAAATLSQLDSPAARPTSSGEMRFHAYAMIRIPLPDRALYVVLYHPASASPQAPADLPLPFPLLPAATATRCRTASGEPLSNTYAPESSTSPPYLPPRAPLVVSATTALIRCSALANRCRWYTRSRTVAGGGAGVRFPALATSPPANVSSLLATSAAGSYFQSTSFMAATSTGSPTSFPPTSTKAWHPAITDCSASGDVWRPWSAVSDAAPAELPPDSRTTR
mmetsp:Transcript_23676/g.66410  ORF Transcript_23676/g.66410 Transcript_23676/m.66410 type:complete len:241 (+) Transcript_23676:2042-2764(+)